MGRLSQKAMDVVAIKQSIQSQGEFRVHLAYSRGGTVTARMWHPDGFKVGSAGGGGYDKYGTALGEAIMLFFAEELKALPLPVRRSNGSVESGLYGMAESKDGKRYLDGGCGIERMLDVLRALGFEVDVYATGKNSEMVLARKAKGGA